MGKRILKLSKEEFFRKIFHTYWKEGKQYSILNVPYDAEIEFTTGAINSISYCLAKNYKELPIDEFLYQCYCFYIDEIEPMYKKNLKSLLDLRKNYGYISGQPELNSKKKIVQSITEREWGFIVGSMQQPSKNRDINSVFFEAFGRWSYMQPMFQKKGRQKARNEYFEEIIRTTNTNDKIYFQVIKEYSSSGKQYKHSLSSPEEALRRQVDSYAKTHEIEIKKRKKR